LDTTYWSNSCCSSSLLHSTFLSPCGCYMECYSELVLQLQESLSAQSQHLRRKKTMKLTARKRSKMKKVLLQSSWKVNIW